MQSSALVAELFGGGVEVVNSLSFITSLVGMHSLVDIVLPKAQYAVDEGREFTGNGEDRDVGCQRAVKTSQ